MVDVLVAGPSLLLVASGLEASNERSVAMKQHGVIPEVWGPLVGRVLPLALSVCGSLGVMASMIDGGGSGLVGPAAAAYVALAVYSWSVLRRVRSLQTTVPCGCVGPTSKMSGLTVGRALIGALLISIGGITSVAEFAITHALAPTAFITALMYFAPWLASE